MPEIQKFPFKIGADPEFNVLIQDRHFKADALFKSLFGNKFPEKTMGYKVDSAGEVGWDGNSDIAEIRPTPAYTPEKLAANIKKLIKTVVDNGPMLELSTLCDMGTVGGHIHFEMPKGAEAKSQNILSGIDKKLSSFYVPLLQNEDIINMKTRAKSTYGKLTDYRVDQHGDAWTFEFRSPSAEWLTTEKIAVSTLAYFATVYNEIMFHPKNFSKCNDFIFKNEKQSEAIQSLALSNYIIIMNNFKSKIRKYIKTFAAYKQYQKEIEFILSADRVQKEKIKAGYNMAVGWGLTTYKQPNKRLLFSKELANAKNNNNLDLETLIKILPVNYNQDINVADFVNALKYKIIRFNWKLKYVYYFFGLKKGIEDFIIADKNMDWLYGKEQIKTMGDYDEIRKTFTKMNAKFPYLRTRQQSNTEKNNKNYIIMGIPYDLRLNLKTKPMLERLYEIEKGKLKAFKVDSASLPNEIANGKEMKSPGEIYKIYQGLTDEVNTLSEPHRVDGNLANRDIAEIELRTETAQEENL